RVGVALALVGGAVDGDQVARIVREVPLRLIVQIASALLPRIGQGHDMVDLHGGRGLDPSTEGDRLPRVRVLEGAGDDRALLLPRLEGDVDEVAPEDVVTGVAAVAPQVDGHLVGPGRTEQRTVVATLRFGGPDGQCRQRLEGFGGVLDRAAAGTGRFVVPHGFEEDDDHADHDEAQDPDPTGNGRRASARHMSILLRSRTAAASYFASGGIFTTWPAYDRPAPNARSSAVDPAST